MKPYYCKNCKYWTEKLSHFKDHIISKKHIDNMEMEESNNVKILDANTNYENCRVKIYCCDICDNVYMSNQALKRHKIHCKNILKIEDLKHENDELKQELKNKTNQLENKDKQLDKALEIAKENIKVANTSMNMLKYAKIYLNDVEPFEELKGNEIYDVMKYKNPQNTEAKNEAYVKTAVHKFTHGVFDQFIGDMITNYYEPKTKKEANLIATDTSRSCFIIMHKITKGKNEQKEWINDKSGKKFTELVLKPLIGAVKNTLTEFVEFKKRKELNEITLCLMAKCIELKRDIDVDKFTKKILKYVAPSFHFDKIKILDEENENSVVSSKKNKLSNMTNTTNITNIKKSNLK